MNFLLVLPPFAVVPSEPDEPGLGSTETTDPEKALLFKMRFLEQQETRKADGVESADLTSESLASVAKLYFDWKLANNSPETVS